MAGNDSQPLEIERKFLIRRPDEARLRAESTGRIEITQTYLRLEGDASSRRVRRSRSEGRERLYYTEKVHLTDVTRIEREREITPEEYAGLLTQADPARRTIEKVRWRVPLEGRTLEIDIFPFWDDRAFCEIELGAEDELFTLPGWIEVIREVTADRRYTNYALAREIPREELPGT